MGPPSIADVAKEALGKAEMVIGNPANGLHAAASQIAGACVASPSKNRACKKLRMLHSAACLDRHFTQIGSATWLDSLQEDLAQCALSGPDTGTENTSADERETKDFDSSSKPESRMIFVPEEVVTQRKELDGVRLQIKHLESESDINEDKFRFCYMEMSKLSERIDALAQGLESSFIKVKKDIDEEKARLTCIENVQVKERLQGLDTSITKLRTTFEVSLEQHKESLLEHVHNCCEHITAGIDQGKGGYGKGGRYKNSGTWYG